MEPSLLMWRFFTLFLVTDCLEEFCISKPPKLRHATYKALTYKMGTLVNCECKKGFRRMKRGSLFLQCMGNSSHSSWKNQCQCKSTSSTDKGKQVTPKPEEQKERNTTDMQSQMQPTDQVPFLGHCREPPPWDHEASERIYHFMVGQTIHYECVQGFRALQGGPAKSICKMICGKVEWTQPQLKCINESQFPGDQEPQASMDTPSGSETSCPLITTGTTTDFQKHTEVATTMEPVIFTTEYQMTVAFCVLLLISVLLLSGLSWQRRWRKSRRTI